MNQGNLYFDGIMQNMSNLRDKNSQIKILAEQLKVRTLGKIFNSQEGTSDSKQKLEILRRECIVIVYNLSNDLQSMRKMAPYLSSTQQDILFEINKELETNYIPNIKKMGLDSDGAQIAESNDRSISSGYGGYDMRQNYQMAEQLHQDLSYDLELREKQMKELQEEAVTVNYLFKKVSELINDQGEMVDNFDEHIHIAADDVHYAAEELNKLNNSKASSRKCWCICGTVVGVFIFVIVVVGLVILMKPHS